MVRSQRIVANLGREDLLAVTNVIEMDYNAFVESKPYHFVQRGCPRRDP